MKKNTILVCGATGFIGRNMAEYFAKDLDTKVRGTFFKSPPLEDSKIEMIHADLTDKKDVERVVKGVDVLIHTASVTSGSKDIVERPHIHITDNAIMNSLLFRSAYEAGVKHFIFFSCSVMYQPSETPVKEEDFSANDEIYDKYFGVGWTKVYSEKMCEFYSRVGETRYTVIRHSNIYGPYDKYDLDKSHVFGATIAKVLQSQNGKVVVWGEGKESRDFLHIDDLVNFVKLVIEKQKNKYALYNAGSGKAVTVKKLVEKIISSSGKELSIEYNVAKPSIPTTLALDIGRAKCELEWVPKISLEEGIYRTLEWYKKNINL